MANNFGSWLILTVFNIILYIKEGLSWIKIIFSILIISVKLIIARIFLAFLILFKQLFGRFLK